MEEQDSNNFSLQLRKGSPTIDSAQLRIAQWVFDTLGAENYNNPQERSVRLLEEAMELAQALEVDRKVLHRLVDYVYNRPVGEVSQELAGSAVTLLACAASTNVSLSDALLKEIERIETPEIRDKVRRRQEEKRESLMTIDRPDGRDLHLVNALEFGYIESLDYDEAFNISRDRNHPRFSEVMKARIRAKNETFSDRMGSSGLTSTRWRRSR